MSLPAVACIASTLSDEFISPSDACVIHSSSIVRASGFVAGQLRDVRTKMKTYEKQTETDLLLSTSVTHPIRVYQYS